MQEWNSMKARATVDYFSNLSEGKMLNQGDFDPNSLPSDRDLSKDRIKQTMLNQELVFRKQVFELHQLYKTQIAMMEDFKEKSLVSLNLNSLDMSPLLVKLNNQLSCSMPPALMPKPLDLKLSADDFISQCADGFPEERVLTSLEESIVAKDSSQNRVIFDLNQPNLSLNIGQDAKLKGGEHRSLKGKETCSSSINIIDLEGANSSLVNYEAYHSVNPGSSASRSHSGEKYKIDCFLKDDKQNSESFYVGPRCQSDSLNDSGLNRHNSEFFAANFLDLNKDPFTCKVNKLDLNTFQLEDVSCFSNNHSMVGNSSITCSSPVLQKVYPDSTVAFSGSPTSWREADVYHLIHKRNIDQQKNMNLEGNVGELCSKVHQSREGNQANISIVNLDSDSFEELCSGRPVTKISSVVSSSKISNGHVSEMDSVDAVEMKVILENRVERPNYCKLSSSSESECLNDLQSSSLKTMQSGAKCDGMVISTSFEREKFNIGPQVTHLGEQDLRSAESTESNTQCIIMKESENDGTVHTAAEVLVQLYSVTGTCSQESQDDLAKMPLKKFQNEGDDQPQSSSESYEALVLKAEESSADDYCVSSNPYMVDETEKKEVGYKLKRGTRLKNFQKDILPCLSTLSRHEIREDLNILEGILRSQDCKTMGDGGDDFCRSTRSKRSRVNRRYHA